MPPEVGMLVTSRMATALNSRVRRNSCGTNPAFSNFAMNCCPPTKFRDMGSLSGSSPR
jgi:hypothetical protein